MLRCVAVLGGFFNAAAAWGAPIDFPPTDFKLLSADASAEIGRARFEIVARTSGRILVQGKYQFTNGEYDIDEDWLEMGPGMNLPVVLNYKHTFFQRDGSPDRVSQADFKSGQAGCTIYVNGRADIQTAKLAFPPDTYAGPAVMLPVREFIRRGSAERPGLHVFSCAPAPKIYLVRASIARNAEWSFYHGKLVQVDIEPDFGRLEILLAPFLPKIRLWFDPVKDFELVGAESSRYYRGLKFIMVRHPAAR
jgi:hypothetical protein